MSFSPDEQMLRYMAAQSQSLERIEALLMAAGEARSSVQIATSTRGCDVTVKGYAGSPLGSLGDEVLAEWTRITVAANDATLRELNKMAGRR